MKRGLAWLLCLSLLLGGAGAAAAGDGPPSAGLPVMSVTLDDGKRPSAITKDTYLPASFTLEDGETTLRSAVFIKGRGNATWEVEKKPFALKFSEKTDLFGMGKAKKWVLLANYWDKTLLRNALTLTVGRRMGIPFTPECRFVDMYLNGQYQGNYLLTEKVEIGKNRIAIDDTAGGVLFEIEMAYRHGDCTYCHETPAGVHVTYKEPEQEDLGTDAMAALMRENNAFLNEMEASLSQGYDAYTRFIDVDSFINWYILNEWAKNYDSAFVTSCYCYRDAGGKLFMGPPWDYDTCYGNQDVATGLDPTGYHVAQVPWFAALLRDEDFRQRLHQRWTELSDEGVWDGVSAWLEEQAAYIAESQRMEQQRWPNAMAQRGLRGSGPAYTTYAEELTYLQAFIARRTAWLDKAWSLNNPPTDGGFVRADPVTATAVSLQAPDGMPHENADNLFDGDLTTKYCTSAPLPLIVTWTLEQPVAVTCYAVGTANDMPARDPCRWILLGSTDGEAWQTVSAVPDGDLPEDRFCYREFFVDEPVAYAHYRFIVETIRGENRYVQFSELRLGQGDTAALRRLWQLLPAEAPTLTDVRALYGEAVPLMAAIRPTERPYLGKTRIDAFDALRARLDAALGDVDQNGAVDAADALLALQHSVRLTELQGDVAEAADVDGSGSINSVDALWILQRSVRLIDSFV